MKKEIKEMVLKIVDDCFYIFASGYREEAENNARIVFEELYPQLSQPNRINTREEIIEALSFEFQEKYNRSPFIQEIEDDECYCDSYVAFLHDKLSNQPVSDEWIHFKTQLPTPKDLPFITEDFDKFFEVWKDSDYFDKLTDNDRDLFVKWKPINPPIN